MSRQKKFYIEPRKPSGIYYYIVLDPVSRKTITYRSTGTTDERQANAIGMDWWTNGIPGKTSSTGMDRKTLFCDYLIQFWDFKTSDYFRELETMGREPHPEHALEMQRIVERYYRPYFQSKLLCQINEEALQKFVVYLKIEKKLAPATVNLARNTAMKALRYAKRKHIIKEFDFDAVLRAGGKASERGILEKEEVDKLLGLEWDSLKSRIAVCIAYYTGMRMGEARSLLVSDIHPDHISVRHSWGKISKLKGTKNQEIREIPILPALYEEIMAYIKKTGLLRLDSLLLPGKNPEKPYDDRTIGREFNKMLEKIGIDDKTRKERGIVYHSLRHGLAKNLVEKGTNKAIGMKILGQKTSIIFSKQGDYNHKE
jgi:integrase